MTPNKRGPGRPRVSAVTRFWKTVDKTPHCWVWKGSPNSRGYGKIWTGDKRELAHRFSWNLHRGNIPDGYEIDHICHNRMCVNPDHLRVVTPTKNKQHLRGAGSNSKTGVRGVTITRNGRYQALVICDGVRHYLGRFDALIDAERAVLAKRLELFDHNHVDHIRAIELGLITGEAAVNNVLKEQAA